ncbi:MoxR family ATPase [Streptomyces sp. TLI_185]|uniref:AAA family ATPase n=1 Tax=Streptomyces sp. TLI_185 TaxID=2485151 RepID=UPI000F907E0D|nr:MoxR family ATPase [Streptomyces sp. TLI_185]RPF36189.1 dynein-related subfamily AAA family protein [Streptomyces sp. TLI_185]
MTDWLIYRGTGEPHDGAEMLPAPPPWRDFDGGPLVTADPEPDWALSRRRLGSGGSRAAGASPGGDELDIINAALYLRRPLLITGAPGSGKSTIPYSVADELRLGRVLRWPIVSRSNVRDGLYSYDAIGRLQDSQLGAAVDDIGRYIRLGPLGTALLPSRLPRVLLIDEIDKSDIDLPNDLLNVLEEGEFAIPELERAADRIPEATVFTDDGLRVTVRGGRVRCRAFPFVVLASNGERDFPAPLLRRCLHLEMPRPDERRLAAMVRAHFGDSADGRMAEYIARFLDRGGRDVLAVDQLLNALYLAGFTGQDDMTRERLADLLMRPLDPQG